jgi:hypothetical protein
MRQTFETRFLLKQLFVASDIAIQDSSSAMKIDHAMSGRVVPLAAAGLSPAVNEFAVFVAIVTTEVLIHPAHGKIRLAGNEDRVQVHTVKFRSPSRSSQKHRGRYK